jgi:PAS domain S-box-containing protein
VQSHLRAAEFLSANLEKTREGSNSMTRPSLANVKRLNINPSPVNILATMRYIIRRFGRMLCRYRRLEIVLGPVLLLALVLCTADQGWAGKEVFVGIPRSLPPFSFIDQESGGVRGFCVDLAVLGDLPGKTVAVVRGSDHLDVDINNKDITFIEVNSPLEALQLVNSGVADAYIAYSALTAHYLIQKHELQNIKRVGVATETVSLSLAVRKDNPELLKELSVAFGRILEKGDLGLFREKWLGKGLQSDPWARYVKPVAFTSGLILTGVLVLLVWNRLLKKKVNEMTNDLRVSERKYRDLIESSPEMICLITEDGTIKLANQIALKSLGLRQEEIVQLKLCELVLAEQQQRMNDFVTNVFAKGVAQEEFVFQDKDGELINVETVATIVKAEDDSMTLACCFSRDISERRRLEDELVQSERLVTMGQMAAGIAHEINNPLGIILANAQDTLNSGLDREDTLRNLHSIERSALRAGKIIDNLLSFTRPTPFSRTAVDLLQLIDQSLFILKQHLKEKRIRIKEEVPNSPLTLLGDENQIQQLLLNLFLNSIEAIEQQGTITIRAREKVDGNSEPRRIHLEVEDTGKGIPEEELPKIFDPFFTSRKKRGFGLGLYISKTIVEKHNGTIVTSSNEGQGTLTTVELPI